MERAEENEVPLLSDHILYPNCPGCKCAHLSAKGEGPPFKQLFLVGLVVVCNALPICSMFPFLYFMVDDFNIAKRPEDVGYYAGAMGSIFLFGSFLAAVPWGMFSDKYGRKSVMNIGCISIIIFQTVFGVSKSYWLAFVCRFALGIFNGMLGPLKAYASEICSEESQPWGLSTVSTSWSFALIFGPALGGFLARPALNFPGIFSEDSLFGLYPYLLPSLVQAVYAGVMLVVIYFLPETIHKHDNEDPSDAEEKSVTTVEPPTVSLWTDWPVMASVTVYCVWALYDICFSEIFSFWCVTSVDTGGLGLQTSDVGTILSISGVAMLCGQMSIFPFLAKYLGPIKVTRFPAMMVIPLVILFPFTNMLHGTAQMIIVTMLSMIRNMLGTFVITGTFLLLNNTVPTDKRGAANGLSLMCVSIFRAVGPAFAGAIFAWGQKRQEAKFLPGNQMAFASIVMIALIAVLTTFPPFLPKSINRPYLQTLRETQEEKKRLEKNSSSDHLIDT